MFESWIESAQIVVRCPDVSAVLSALTEQCGFRLEMILPADAPTTAVVSGHGVRLRLEQRSTDPHTPPVALRLQSGPHSARLANTCLPSDCGLQIEVVPEPGELKVPAGSQQFVLTRAAANSGWHAGRAGMRYRDLIPGRLGGRFIGSHIMIPEGGPVPDYVHYHRVRFQTIYCRSGWARLVYEDQGAPFRFEAGDCVLQPPDIRHRVLEASAAFEAIELACPAVHETHVDHGLVLPNGNAIGRRYGGQHFVRHVAAASAWEVADDADWTHGFAVRNAGIDAATEGLACVRVLRAVTAIRKRQINHSGELLFFYLLRGSATVSVSSCVELLNEDDCCVIPADADFSLGAATDSVLLSVTLPAQLPFAFVPH